MGLITNDTNNDTYYSYDNINPNTCNIDYNNQARGSQIYTIYGITGTNILSGNPAVYCDFDFDVNIFGYLLPQFYSTPIECTNREFIETNLYTIDNLTHYIVLSDPHSNITECIDEHDCIMYINSALYPKQISCNDAYICTVIWFVLFLKYVHIYIPMYKYVVWIHFHVQMVLLMVHNQNH